MEEKNIAPITPDEDEERLEQQKKVDDEAMKTAIFLGLILGCLVGAIIGSLANGIPLGIAITVIIELICKRRRHKQWKEEENE